jgi:hypothetical protein
LFGFLPLPGVSVVNVSLWWSQEALSMRAAAVPPRLTVDARDSWLQQVAKVLVRVL